MFDNIIYKLCDVISNLCDKIKTRIKTTPQKNWVKGYNEWKKKHK
jgi:hypothetical protein